MPVDLFGGGLFPAIGRGDYPVTLTGYGFYWLKLLQEDEAQARKDAPPEAWERPDLPKSEAPQPVRLKA